MHTRLLLLLALFLVIPTASLAGFLGAAGRSNDGIPEIQLPDPFAAPGIPNLSGRASERATFTSGNVVDPVGPPDGPSDPNATVPEPATGLLTLLGLAGLAVAGRRRIA